jgi:hypothetical protein
MQLYLCGTKLCLPYYVALTNFGYELMMVTYASSVCLITKT